MYPVLLYNDTHQKQKYILKFYIISKVIIYKIVYTLNVSQMNASL